MALTAVVATVCAATVAAIRWLGVLGVVRDYAVTHTSGSFPPAGGGWGSTTSSYHRQLGLISGPSAAITHLDAVAWRLGLLAGILWMLRLGLLSADHRIGVLRGFGVVVGFGVFVVTGVLHRIAEVVIPVDRTRRWLDRFITLWCLAAVAGAAVAVFAINLTRQAGGPSTLGDHAVITPLGWSIARNALQLAVAVGGWALAATLTRSWIKSLRANHPIGSVTSELVDPGIDTRSS